MRYFVIGEDGNRYGPADMALLESWAREGRITPKTIIEPEYGGNSIVASSMPTLHFPAVTAPYSGSSALRGPSPYGVPAPSYYRPLQTPGQTYTGTTELRLAYILGIAGAFMELLCGVGFLPAAGGVVLAVVALMRGQRATGALALSLIVIAVHVVAGRFF